MNNKHNNIVIPIDLTHESSWRAALPVAIEQARKDDALLHLVTVVPNADIPAIAVHLPKNFDSHMQSEGEKVLQAFAEQYVPEDVKVNQMVGQGRIYKEILRMAESVDADLIVMASHRPELSDYLISANAAHVTRHAECSVMVVREKRS